jgi:hypothetical protein
MTGTPTLALVRGQTDRDLPIPIEDEVLQGEALTGLGLPLIILGSRPEERDAIRPRTGDEFIGRDVAGVDKMGVGQQTLSFERLIDVFERIAINDGCRRGLYMRDQVRATLVTSLGQMILVASPGRRPLTGIMDLWIVG